MENQRENEIETGGMQGMIIGNSISHQTDGHGFLVRDSIPDYTKVQDGPLCPQKSITDCSSQDLLFLWPLCFPRSPSEVLKSRCRLWQRPSCLLLRRPLSSPITRAKKGLNVIIETK